MQKRSIDPHFILICEFESGAVSADAKGLIRTARMVQAAAIARVKSLRKLLCTSSVCAIR